VAAVPRRVLPLDPEDRAPRGGQVEPVRAPVRLRQYTLWDELGRLLGHRAGDRPLGRGVDRRRQRPRPAAHRRRRRVARAASRHHERPHQVHGREPERLRPEHSRRARRRHRRGPRLPLRTPRRVRQVGPASPLGPAAGDLHGNGVPDRVERPYPAGPLDRRAERHAHRRQRRRGRVRRHPALARLAAVSALAGLAGRRGPAHRRSLRQGGRLEGGCRVRLDRLVAGVGRRRGGGVGASPRPARRRLRARP